MSGKYSSRGGSGGRGSPAIRRCCGAPAIRRCSGSGVGGKVVLVCGRPQKYSYKFNRHIWYTLTLDGESTAEKGKRKKGVLGEQSATNTTKQKSSAIWKTRIVSIESSIAAIGTCIYSMGGHYHDSAPTDEVQFGDLLRADKGWHQVPSSARMNRPRMSATSVTVDRKIYTFGGILPELNPGNSWAEVFDPDLAQWFPLPPPPHILPFVGVFAVMFDDSSRRILVGSQRSGALFIYSISNNSWEQLGVNFPLGGICQPVLVGGCLYWLDTDCIAVFDIAAPKFFEGEIVCTQKIRDKLYTVTECAYIPQFIHLGGDVFSLMWLKTISSDGDLIRYADPDFLSHCHSEIVSANFQVFKGNGTVTASEISVRTYPLDTALNSRCKNLTTPDIVICLIV
ncbi:hypothetical protein RJ639_014509 [Escallonia herrerae]|uniref:Uncharacterized protein n=1 Tax=Escallonia herrerae TaxID=1293975 RepID=A0AA88VGE2_9ASTE|nr:hypothetical protein RJ639_014509 [Escallonia herrerae]